MPRAPVDLARARILVTNDDGINAPGLKVLERVARSLSRQVWVVAPEAEQSGAGHSLTLRRPLRVRRLSARRFAVDGTPTDCVLLAVHSILPKKPDLVLSGVNRGSNLGEDVTYSGTIAAAMEATLLEIPAIAMSQVAASATVKWHTAETHAPEVVRRLAGLAWPEGVLINVNFPDCLASAIAGIKVTRQGRRTGGIELIKGSDPKGRPFLWIGDFSSDETTGEGTDLAAMFERMISVSPLHLDLTHDQTLGALRRVFS
jgi:5'/3'-nucleotidase